jgi:hypothetical protein
MNNTKGASHYIADNLWGSLSKNGPSLCQIKYYDWNAICDVNLVKDDTHTEVRRNDTVES